MAISSLCGQFRSHLLAFASGGDAVFHPHGHRRAFQVVVEELLQTDGDVLAVLACADIVRLAVVLQHPYGLLQAAQRHEHLDALIPRHCAVLVVVHDEQRRIDAVSVEHRGVGDVELRCFPQVAAYARLSALILRLARFARTPSYAAESGGHVCHRRARAGASEHVGARNKERCLVAAPALSVDADAVTIYPRVFLAEVFHAGAYIVVCTFARYAGGVFHVGNEHHISTADVERVVDPAP